MGKRWIPTYNVTPTLTHPSRWRSPTSRDRLYQSSRRHPRTYILTYLFQKTNFSKICRALFENHRGWTPTSSNSSPHVTYPRIFFRLSTSTLINGFTQALPTSTSTPTMKPSSDPTPRVTYPWIFSASPPPFSQTFYARTPNLHRHQYTNAIFGSPSSPYVR